VREEQKEQCGLKKKEKKKEYKEKFLTRFTE